VNSNVCDMIFHSDSAPLCGMQGFARCHIHGAIASSAPLVEFNCDNCENTTIKTILDNHIYYILLFIGTRKITVIQYI
jgi:hypothetical protein